MRLGRWLRLLGQNVANPKGESDEELLHQAKEDGRIIITRDKKLFQACRSAGMQCVLIRSTAISDQLQEMAKMGVPLWLDPHRCTVCNGPLDEIGPSGRQWWQCRACKKLYWEGGHWQKMKEMLQAIRLRMEDNAGQKEINNHL